VPTLGETLRQARVAKKAKLGQVEAETRIERARLEALESDDLASLPDDVYTKGAIRNYAPVPWTRSRSCAGVISRSTAGCRGHQTAFTGCDHHPPHAAHLCGRVPIADDLDRSRPVCNARDLRCEPPRTMPMTRKALTGGLKLRSYTPARHVAIRIRSAYGVSTHVSVTSLTA